MTHRGLQLINENQLTPVVDWYIFWLPVKLWNSHRNVESVMSLSVYYMDLKGGIITSTPIHRSLATTHWRNIFWRFFFFFANVKHTSHHSWDFCLLVLYTFFPALAITRLIEIKNLFTAHKTLANKDHILCIFLFFICFLYDLLHCAAATVNGVCVLYTVCVQSVLLLLLTCVKYELHLEDYWRQVFISPVASCVT